MGKGDGRRVEDTQKVRDNWDAAFSPKGKKENNDNRKQDNRNRRKKL